MRDYYCCPYKENFMCHTWINLVIKENIEFFFSCISVKLYLEV